jgi:hypothetical protein
MAIESYRAAKQQIQSEARSDFFPGLEIAIKVAKKAAGLAHLEFPEFLNLCTGALETNTRENLSYLFESLVEDVRRMDIRIEDFENSREAERKGLNQLVSEAVVRASEAKSRERVRRIARILANALRSGPKENYEREREFIDAATQVAESDAAILGRIMKYQGEAAKNGSPDMNLANETWQCMHKEDSRFRDPHIHVSCARLQALGLIIRMDRRDTTLDLATNAYLITRFGVEFCEWCLSELDYK